MHVAATSHSPIAIRKGGGGGPGLQALMMQIRAASTKSVLHIITSIDPDQLHSRQALKWLRLSVSHSADDL